MRASLLQDGVELDERDFFQDPFSEDELRSLVAGTPVEGIFSWNSPSFKKLGLDREDLADDQLVQMMLDEPRLIRRPIIQAGNDLIVGSNKTALDQLEKALS